MNFYITLAVLIGGVGLFFVWALLQTRHDDKDREARHRNELRGLLTQGIVPSQQRRSATDSYVSARVDEKTKEQAATALRTMGLSVEDAIRLMLRRVADERCLPFEARGPQCAPGQVDLESSRKSAPA